MIGIVVCEWFQPIQSSCSDSQWAVVCVSACPILPNFPQFVLQVRSHPQKSGKVQKIVVILGTSTLFLPRLSISRQFAGDAFTYPPWPTGSRREILGQPGQSRQKIPKPELLKDMGLAKRLATGWPIGQPVANPAEISIEQQTDSQTSKSSAIFPHQHQLHTTSNATREERGLAPYSVPVPFLPGADQ